MYELIQVGEKTYYIDCPSRIGVYAVAPGRVCFIDGGSDKDAAKKALKILDSQGWTLECVLNTHSHADHVGGNALLQQRTGCRVYVPEGELAFARSPVLEPALLFGAAPLSALQNKFLMAAPSDAEPLQTGIPQGIEACPLPGHSPDMTGFRTSDGVWFLGDSLVGQATLEKHGVFYLYDVQKYFESLKKVEALQGSCFIPSHAPAETDIRDLAEKNRKKLEEILCLLEESCREETTTEELIQAVFSHFELNMDISQNVLVGAAVKACLSYLEKEEKVEFFFQNHLLKWKARKG